MSSRSSHLHKIKQDKRGTREQRIKRRDTTHGLKIIHVQWLSSRSLITVRLIYIFQVRVVQRERESWPLWNYPGRSTYHEIIQVNRASDSNYVTVRPRLSQLSGYISKFSSGLMALLKFRPLSPRPTPFLFRAFWLIDVNRDN